MPVSLSLLLPALAAGLLASLGCGVVGSYVVVRRISFIAGGIAHAAFGGIGAAIYFGLDPTTGALLSALLIAATVAGLREGLGVPEDILVSALWPTGMAVGVLFLAASPGYQSDLVSYLFGNILLVAPADLVKMLVLDVVLVLVVIGYREEINAVLFDPEFARLRGIPVAFFYTLLLVLVALTVVLSMRVAGLVLVLAMMTLPAATAGCLTRTIDRMMLLATLLGGLCISLGLALSWISDLPTSPLIVLLAAALYVLALLLSRVGRTTAVKAHAG